MLPADVAEHARLDIQHEMFKHRFNGLVVPEAAKLVQGALSYAEQPAVLDVGTGSGAWSIEMATLYPNARVVGIDLAPVNPGRYVPRLGIWHHVYSSSIRPIPSNCQFEVHDANNGVKPYHGQFDVVHCRCVSHGILDFKAFLVEAAECLKPGGILLVIGADGMTMFNERQERITELTPGTEGFSHFNRMSEAARIAGTVSRMSMIEKEFSLIEDIYAEKEGRRDGRPYVHPGLAKSHGWDIYRMRERSLFGPTGRLGRELFVTFFLT